MPGAGPGRAAVHALRRALYQEFVEDAVVRARAGALADIADLPADAVGLALEVEAGDAGAPIGPIVGELCGLGDPDMAFKFGIERLLDGFAALIERKF